MHYLKLIMKNNLNFLVMLSRFARFPFPYQHTALEGVIKCKQLDAFTNEEIVAGLHDQHVIANHRFAIQPNSETIYTNTYIITFITFNTLPEILKIGLSSGVRRTVFTCSPTLYEMPEIWSSHY